MASDQSAREVAASAQTGTESEATRQHVPRQRPRHDARAAEREPSGAALGITLTAAIMMMISGGWNILEGQVRK